MRKHNPKYIDGAYLEIIIKYEEVPRNSSAIHIRKEPSAFEDAHWVKYQDAMERDFRINQE